MTKTEYTEVTDLRMTARPGASIGACMREAVLVACSEWQNVVLTHKGKCYRVLCNDLLGCVEEMQEEL